MLSFFLGLSRAKLLLIAGATIMVVALIDWRVELNVSFGFLYPLSYADHRHLP